LLTESDYTIRQQSIAEGNCLLGGIRINTGHLNYLLRSCVPG
jgi:hypothetical protein